MERSWSFGFGAPPCGRPWSMPAALSFVWLARWPPSGRRKGTAGCTFGTRTLKLRKSISIPRNENGGVSLFASSLSRKSCSNLMTQGRKLQMRAYTVRSDVVWDPLSRGGHGGPGKRSTYAVARVGR
ncbi:hypothetical protein BHE74_00009253 [Ensete ventricosum]|nr:hypothetical protein BHE74_00009253 [Ensete ventricosum]